MKSSVVGLSVRFFNRMLTMGGALTNRPFAIRCTRTSTESAATLAGRRLPGRTAMSFVRSDNMPSLRANRKMGKMELGEFVHNCETYIVFAFTS